MNTPPHIPDHPRRYALANELHARPFPTLAAPVTAICLAIKRPEDAARRDRGLDRAHLVALLDRFGADHPPEGATHYSGEIGRNRIKWESHTEFVTYTLFVAGTLAEGDGFAPFPADWLANIPGALLTAMHIQIVARPADAALAEMLRLGFVPESLAACEVLDGAAVLAGDFRITAQGMMNFLVAVSPGTGDQRVGRIVQRLCEIETYKSMALLGYVRAREVSTQLGQIDERLNGLIGQMPGEQPAVVLDALLPMTAALEDLSARASFRFSVTRAYGALVADRVAVLRETRLGGRQTLAEFMARRFEPTMRTTEATGVQLNGIRSRAFRAAEILRTRVEVERSAQSQLLLESMDRRADQQLHLQTTVEGLSVVAISYYAVNLLAALLLPIAKTAGLGKSEVTGALVLPVALGVWWVVRRIRNAVR